MNFIGAFLCVRLNRIQLGSTLASADCFHRTGGFARAAIGAEICINHVDAVAGANCFGRAGAFARATHRAIF